MLSDKGGTVVAFEDQGCTLLTDEFIYNGFGFLGRDRAHGMPCQLLTAGKIADGE